MKEGKIDKVGRAVIPISFRMVLGLKSDDRIVLSLVENSVVIRPCAKVCRICGTEITNMKENAIPLCAACVLAVKNA